MRRFFIWFWLLTKRLYKRPTFLAILLLIPVLSLIYSYSVDTDAGVLTVALATKEPSSLTDQVFTDLQENGNLISYRVCNPEEARLLVETGKADAAWIFDKDLECHIENFTQEPEPFIEVLQREDNVALMLSRERLTGQVYPYLAQQLYLHYIRENVPELSNLSDEALLEYYRDTNMNGQLFSYDHDIGKASTTHYLQAPLRGLLAVVVVLCGLASSMYYIQDQQKGTFSYLPRKAILPELGSNLVAVFQVGLAVLIALLATGLAKGLGMEILALLLYSLCVTGFCMMLRALLGRISLLGSILPLLMVVMLAVCPVFLDLGALRLFQFLLPPTYFINCVYNPSYFMFMGIYALANLALYLLLRKCFNR